MRATLAALLVATGTPAGPVVQPPEPGPAPAIRSIATEAEVAALCTALTPPERLRPEGDAVERGEAEARHELSRDEAITGRYELAVPGAKLPFAPYDGPERRLSLADPAAMELGSTARIWVTEERGLPVQVDAVVARRILEAQRAGRLALALVFDLPDDATCGSDPRGRTFTLGVEPVEWRWLDGPTVVARGGSGADRPLVSAAEGARPRVAIGNPIAGSSDAKEAVVARASDLEACYADVLRRDPGVDGVLVVELSRNARLAIAADSTGAPDLAACVVRVLGGVAPPEAGRSAVPIRFELLAPTPEAAPVPAAR